MSKGTSKRARAQVKAAQRNAQIAKNKAQKLKKAQIKEMRPFLNSLREIDLRHALTPSQKGKVTKAWREYQALTVRPTKIFRTKNKKNLSEAQKLSSHSGKTKWDVAFVPVHDASAKIKFKNGRAIIRTKYLDIDNVLFDLRNLIENPELEIDRALNSSMGANRYVVMAGEYEFNGALAPEQVLPLILKLIERYSPGGAGYNKRGSNSYFANWLFGIKAFYAKNQDDIREFRKQYGKVNEANKRKKKAGRRKRKQIYGSKD